MRKLFILLAISCSAQAAIWQRTADQRSKLPESVSAGRTDWGADASFGYNQNTGNLEQTTDYAGLSLFKTMDSTSWYLDGSFLYSKYGANVLQDQRNAVLRVDYPQSEHFKWFAFNTQGSNKAIRLDYRTTVGAGPWYDFIGKGWKNGVSVAPSFFYEDFAGAPVDRYMRVSLRDNFSFKLNDQSGFGFDLFYMPRWNELIDHQDYFQPYFETNLYGNSLSLKLMYTVEFNSRPQPGVRKTDTEYLNRFDV